MIDYEDGSRAYETVEVGTGHVPNVAISGNVADAFLVDSSHVQCAITILPPVIERGSTINFDASVRAWLLADTTKPGFFSPPTGLS